MWYFRWHRPSSIALSHVVDSTGSLHERLSTDLEIKTEIFWGRSDSHQNSQNSTTHQPSNVSIVVVTTIDRRRVASRVETRTSRAAGSSFIPRALISQVYPADRRPPSPTGPSAARQGAATLRQLFRRSTSVRNGKRSLFLISYSTLSVAR